MFIIHPILSWVHDSTGTQASSQVPAFLPLEQRLVALRHLHHASWASHPTADHLGGGKGWWRISTYWHTVVKSLPKRKHKKWQWKIHHEWVKMYFLLKIRIFQPVMLIFRGFWIHFPTFTVEGFFRSTSTINRTSNIQHIKRHTSHYIYNMPFCEGDNFRAIFKI